MFAEKHSSEVVALSLTLAGRRAGAGRAVERLGRPGTQVSITHIHIAPVQDESETASMPLAAAYPAFSAING